MTVLADFILNFFNLAVFWYYLRTFLKAKSFKKYTWVILILVLAGVWAGINYLEYQKLNLLVLVFVLAVMSMFFRGRVITKVMMILLFIAMGILMEPVGLYVYRQLGVSGKIHEGYLYFLIAALIDFARGNLVYIICKLGSHRDIHFSRIPKEIMGVLLITSVAVIFNCCVVIDIAIEAGTEKSLNICISIIVSMILTYYFMLYMMERFSYLMNQRYEDELYREEMKYKETYYNEMEKRNQYIQDLKHDMKNRLYGLLHLLEQNDTEALAQRIGVLCAELGKVDNKKYSDNPVVDSVLRVKMGIAKEESIAVNTEIRIPKEMQLDYGDIGVLYGNLLDNAIEACRKVEQGKRFIRVENKYFDGKLLLVIANSKVGEVNKELRTTKTDKEKHGRGISSVRKVVEKYNGTVDFEERTDIFEVSVILYGIKIPGRG